MTVLLFATAAIVSCVYLALGRRLGLGPAIRHIGAHMDEDRASYPFLAKDEAYVSRWHRMYSSEAAGILWMYTFFWPILTIVSTVRRMDQKAIGQQDPYLREQIVENQRARIEELERELGMR